MLLVICIGNESRGDDGAGREVCRLLGEACPDALRSGVIRTLSAPQVDVTMAAEIADADEVVFVDADRRLAPPLESRPLEPTPVAAGATSHDLSPGGLLALCEALYGHTPASELLTLAAPVMEHGEGLSETARAACEEAARVIGGKVGC